MLHPFIQETVKSIGQIFSRFPLTLLCAFLITGCTLYGNYTESWPPVLVSIIMTVGLGLIHTLMGHIISEAYPLSSKWKWVLWGIILVFLGCNFVYWKGILEKQLFTICSAVFYSGLIMLSIILVSLSPYFKRGLYNQKLLTFNRQVFTAYVFSGLLATILYIALSMAILAVVNLFDINVDDKIYLYLMIFIAGIVWTFLFLNWVPTETKDESTSSFPAFRFIIQFIGIPVVIVYALILVFYASANLFVSDRMEEWILWLILWFYIIGFLIFCLNYSVRESKETKWSIWFSKWYLWGSIPIAILNIIGLWKAISNQGVTELTYILATFSLFLVMASAYLLWSGQKDMRKVLGLMFLLIMVSTLGPFNMCKATVNSQLDKLEEGFIDRGIIKAGQLAPIDDFSYQNDSPLLDQMNLLANRGALQKIKQWDKGDILSEVPYDPIQVSEALGLINTELDAGKNFFIREEGFNNIELENYQMIIPIFPASGEFSTEGYSLRYDNNQPTIELYLGREKVESFILSDFLKKDSISETSVWLLSSVQHEIRIHLKYAELNRDLVIVNIDAIALYKNNNYEN